MFKMKLFIDWLARTNIFLYAIITTVLLFIVRGVFYGIAEILNVPDIQFRERPINSELNISSDLIVDGVTNFAGTKC